MYCEGLKYFILESVHFQVVKHTVKKLDELYIEKYYFIFQLCTTWLQILNIEKLKGISVKNLRKSYRVCDNHFNDKARISDGKGRRGSTIKADAVPSPHLPRQGKIKDINVLFNYFVLYCTGQREQSYYRTRAIYIICF